MNTTVARRLGVLAVGASLTLGALSVTPAQAATSGSAALGAGWLNGDLPAGNVYTVNFGGTDYNDTGLTIDTGFAAVAAGNAALLDRVKQGVAATAQEYTGFGSGSTAKALAFAVRAGANPRDFGGLDLVALLESKIDANGRISGSGNVIGQGFAAEGLTVVGSPKAATVTSYLQGLQCPSGAFGQNLPAAGAAASCTDPGTPGPDNTALVTTALARLAPNASLNTTIDKAAAYVAAQGTNGSYGNSNSTGLAAALLGVSCRVGAADAAADVVRALQVPTGASGGFAGQAGAVAYDQGAYTSAQTTGITDSNRDQFRRATNQATTGLVWDTSAPASLSIAGPTASVPAGSAQTLTITGASKGETVCLTAPNGTVSRLVGTGAPITVPVTAPASGTATYAATSGPGTATRTLTAAAPVPATTPLEAKVKGKRFAPGQKVKVRLTGLTPGERIVVKVRGQKVKKAKADGTSDKITFRLPKRFKPGKANVKVKAGADVDKVKIRIKR